MLKQRVLTTVIVLPLAILFLTQGSSLMVLGLFGLFVALGTYEVAKMISPRVEAIMWAQIDPQKQDVAAPIWIILAAILAATGIFVSSSYDSVVDGRGMILVGMLGSILLSCFISTEIELAVGRIFTLLISITYGSFPWLACWDLYKMSDGAACIIFLTAIVFSGDTGAYFGGKKWGKNKLAPKMSPNKTIEGSIAGLASSLVAGLLINALYQGSIAPWSTIILASILGGIFGQMGDLVESTLKRFAKVKDSGNIFPGHGGLLDRFDGILFAAPVVWSVFYFGRL